MPPLLQLKHNPILLLLLSYVLIMLLLLKYNPMLLLLVSSDLILLLLVLSEPIAIAAGSYKSNERCLNECARFSSKDA